MTVFLLVGALMIAVCLLIVLVPLWRHAGQTADRRREANIEIYNQRCQELDREVADNRTTQEEATIEKDRLGARLLSDVDAAAGHSTAQMAAGGSRRRPWLASVFCVLLIAGGGVSAYYWLGDWQALDDSGMPNVDQMVAQLEIAVKAHPDDFQARLMLVQAQQSLGQYDAAAENLHYVNQHMKPPDVRLLGAEAEVRLAAGEALSGAPGALYERILKQDPGNVKALWYLGLRSAEANNPQQAVQYWNRLLEEDLPPDARRMVESRRNALAGDVPGL